MKLNTEKYKVIKKITLIVSSLKQQEVTYRIVFEQDFTAYWEAAGCGFKGNKLYISAGVFRMAVCKLSLPTGLPAFKSIRYLCLVKEM